MPRDVPCALPAANSEANHTCRTPLFVRMRMRSPGQYIGRPAGLHVPECGLRLRVLRIRWILRGCLIRLWSCLV